MGGKNLGKSTDISGRELGSATSLVHPYNFQMPEGATCAYIINYIYSIYNISVETVQMSNLHTVQEGDRACFPGTNVLKLVWKSHHP